MGGSENHANHGRITMICINPALLQKPYKYIQALASVVFLLALESWIASLRIVCS